MTDQARKLLLEGIEHFQAGRLPQAHAALTAAWRIKSHHQVAGALGTVELKLGKFRDASEHLHYFMNSPEADAGEKAQTKPYYLEATSKVGQVSITCNVPTAQITVSGRVVATTQLDLVFVDPGKVAVVATADGYETANAALQVAAGESKKVPLSLRKRDTHPPVTGWPKWPGYTLIGAGVVGIGVGVALMVVSGGKRSDAETLSTTIKTAGGSPASTTLCKDAALTPHPQCGELFDLASSARGLTRGGVAALAVGGALGIGGALYLVLAPRSSETSAAKHQPVQFTPSIAAGTYGVTVSGTF